MATIRARTGPTGDRYQVLFREGNRQRSVTYDDAASAQHFVNLVDRMGPTAALAIIDAQADGRIGEPTVSELCAGHLDSLDSITAGTRKDYASMIARRVTGQPIGELPVSLVTVDHVRSWLAGLEADGLSTKTRRNHHALLSAAFETGITRQLLGRNPARGIKIKTTEADAGRVFLTAGEQAVLVGALPARWQPFVVTLLGTGLRFGEATALHVGDVDLDARVPVLYVRRAWKRSGKGAPVDVGAPKTRAGIRTVSLPPQVVAEIRPLVEGRGADEYVFTAVAGGPIRHDHFHARVWKPTLDKLNARKDTDGKPKAPDLAKRPRIHDLRHSHASGLIAAGVPLTIIQRRLGHESIQTTSDVYGHLAPDHLEVAALAASYALVQAVPEIEG